MAFFFVPSFHFSSGSAAAAAQPLFFPQPPPSFLVPPLPSLAPPAAAAAAVSLPPPPGPVLLPPPSSGSAQDYAAARERIRDPVTMMMLPLAEYTRVVDALLNASCPVRLATLAEQNFDAGRLDVDPEVHSVVDYLLARAFFPGDAARQQLFTALSSVTVPHLLAKKALTYQTPLDEATRGDDGDWRIFKQAKSGANKRPRSQFSGSMYNGTYVYDTPPVAWPDEVKISVLSDANVVALFTMGHDYYGTLRWVPNDSEPDAAEPEADEPVGTERWVQLRARWPVLEDGEHMCQPTNEVTEVLKTLRDFTLANVTAGKIFMRWAYWPHQAQSYDDFNVGRRASDNAVLPLVVGSSLHRMLGKHVSFALPNLARKPSDCVDLNREPSHWMQILRAHWARAQQHLLDTLAQQRAEQQQQDEAERRCPGSGAAAASSSSSSNNNKRSSGGSRNKNKNQKKKKTKPAVAPSPRINFKNIRGADVATDSEYSDSE